MASKNKKPIASRAAGQDSDASSDSPAIVLAHIAEFPASGILPSTALELAHLAAAIDPAGCQGNLKAVENALQKAAALHALSKFYLDEQKAKTTTEFILNMPANTALFECSFNTYYDKIKPENGERLKLRFYKGRISSEPDQVREFFGLKDARGVTARVNAVFAYHAQNANMTGLRAKREVEQRWKIAQRKDERGDIYYAFSRLFLEHAKNLFAEECSQRSFKGHRRPRKKKGSSKTRVK